MKWALQYLTSSAERYSSIYIQIQAIDRMNLINNLGGA